MVEFTWLKPYPLLHPEMSFLVLCGNHLSSGSHIGFDHKKLKHKLKKKINPVSKTWNWPWHLYYMFDTALRLHTYVLCVWIHICRPLVLRCGHDRLLMCKVYNQEHLLNEDVLQSVPEIKLSIHSTLRWYVFNSDSYIISTRGLIIRSESFSFSESFWVVSLYEL